MEVFIKMFDSGTGKIQYITQAGLVFLVFAFVMTLLYFVLSPVVDGFFNAFNVLEMGDATDEIQLYGPLLHTATKIILALGVTIPTVWFIFWCFNREPSEMRRRFL
jgi:hypothetical protein